MNKPLYELTADYAALAEAGETVDLETGEILPVDGLLNLLKGDIEQKATGLLSVSCEWAHRIDALKAEEDRMAKRRRQLDAARDRLRSYLAECMESAGIKKLDAGPWKVTVLAAKESVVCEDASRVPEDFQRVTVAPDIAGAKQMLKETGSLPPGFMVKQGKPSLMVR